MVGVANDQGQLRFDDGWLGEMTYNAARVLASGKISHTNFG